LSSRRRPRHDIIYDQCSIIHRRGIEWRLRGELNTMQVDSFCAKKNLDMVA